ncbi:MAG: hypothetical protein AB1547_12495 [Thermodesulfobacteriota bacterium]
MDAPDRRRKWIDQGWEKQGSFDEPRLSDVVETYREMGFEVRLEPYDPSLDAEGGCTVCMNAAAERFRTVFTRKMR